MQILDCDSIMQYIAIKYNIDTAKAKSTVYSDLKLLFRYIDFQFNAFFQAAKVS